MYVYMGHMRQSDIEPYESWFWKKNRIDLLQDHVLSIDYQAKEVNTSSGSKLGYDKLIIACGSASNKLDIPGIDAKGIKGLYSLQDLDYINSISTPTSKAVIVGGGLIGIELAEMFHSRKIPVTLLVRESAFWNMVLPQQEAELINRHILQHGIDLQLNSELQEIKKNEDGQVNSAVTKSGNIINCDFVGVTVGVHPNIGWLKDGDLEINKGILVDHFLRTNIQDVFAIGDCAELRTPTKGRRSIEAVWYTGRIMGETIAYTVCGTDTPYNPGIWFNSAKFFDIEYHVYGDIRTTLSPGYRTFYWEHADGMKSVRINSDEDDIVLGFNLLGVRFRQEVCEKWISEKTPIGDVIADIDLAFFDPEFSKDYSHALRLKFQKDTGKTITKKSTKNYNPVFQFLTKQKMKVL